MVHIKICGLSEEATLQAAVAAGANFVGLVHFAKSPRHVSLAKATELEKLLPAHVQSVLVVVDPNDALLSDIAATLTPDYIQLHGDETLTRVAEIRKKYPTQKLIKAISVSTKADVGRAKDFEPHVEMLLFDSRPILSSSTPLAGGAGGGNGYFGAGPNTRRKQKNMLFAKLMRQKMTDAEWKLWSFLNGKQLGGYKFRRQQTIGNYIVDFVCMDKKLIIEVDGGQHAEHRLAQDRKRTEYLESLGFRVLRFWNNEVLGNSEGVAEYILAVLNGTVPPPTPPVNGGDEVKAAPQDDKPLPGGNGIAFDYRLLAGFESALPWMLSGGLTAENVATAIAQSGATIVDVSSGVESARGVKDATKIKNFIAAARAL